MGTTFLRNDSWVIEYKLPNGKYKRKSIGKRGIVTKTFAKEVLKQIELKIKKGEYDLIDPEIPFLDEFIVEYINYQREIKQIRSYDRSRLACDHFLRIIGNKQLDKYTPEDIDVFKQRRLDEGVKLNTISRDLVSISNLFNKAKTLKKFFGDNPVSVSGIPRVDDQMERVLSYEEERRLIEATSDYLRDIVVIALNTAMRQREILQMQWNWIDFDENYIFIPSTNNKSKKNKKVPINSTVRNILVRLKLKTGGQLYVFPSPTRADKNLNWIKRSFKTARQKAGIDKLRFHDLRHTAATKIVEAGGTIHTVAKLLGVSLKIAERYCHPVESVKDAVKILENNDLYDKAKKSSE